MTLAPKFCARCKRRKLKGWTCRDCGRRACEHYCQSKVGDVATCGSCSLTSGKRFAEALRAKKASIDA